MLRLLVLSFLTQNRVLMVTKPENVTTAQVCTAFGNATTPSTCYWIPMTDVDGVFKIELVPKEKEAFARYLFYKVRYPDINMTTDWRIEVWNKAKYLPTTVTRTGPSYIYTSTLFYYLLIFSTCIVVLELFNAVMLAFLYGQFILYFQ